MDQITALTNFIVRHAQPNYRGTMNRPSGKTSEVTYGSVDNSNKNIKEIVDNFLGNN